MTGPRNKHAWIWVAIAAISLASVSRAEAGLDSARAYANPVLHFLVKSHSASSVAKISAARSAQRSSILRDARTGTWVAFLPVCFVGLVTLSLSAGESARYAGRTPASPLLPASFQRPPPQLV
ncbi:MAG: hypothetical protein P4L40_20900 [Terracidiphilus sp.]|nr:hypothetical protein [Terracidiphilus sp.]